MSQKYKSDMSKLNKSYLDAKRRIENEYNLKMDRLKKDYNEKSRKIKKYYNVKDHPLDRLVSGTNLFNIFSTPLSFSNSSNFYQKSMVSRTIPDEKHGYKTEVDINENKNGKKDSKHEVYYHQKPFINNHRLQKELNNKKSKGLLEFF